MKLADYRCPYCLTRNDANTSPTDPKASPSAGDVCICIRCRGISVFATDGYRKPSAEERVEIEKHPDVRKILLAMRLMPPVPPATD